jgi:hypothetical protein
VDVRTEELIVALARDGHPVRRLDRPSLRLVRWTAAIIPVTALAAIVIGLRADVSSAITQPAFLGIAAATIATALIAAASALVLSIPGAERSSLQRALPLSLGGLWAVALVVLLTRGGDPLQRLLVWPVHWLCVIEITMLGIVPALALFTMLRRAAPLRTHWSGALATLASVAIGAAATQFLCPVDDPAHQLVGHLFPVAVLSMLGALAGRVVLALPRTELDDETLQQMLRRSSR